MASKIKKALKKRLVKQAAKVAGAGYCSDEGLQEKE